MLFLLPNVGRAFEPNVQWLNVFGDYVDNYDMEMYDPGLPDWPVGMVWGCQANLADVRSYMESSLGPGYGRPYGPSKGLRVWEDSQGGGIQWSGDSGNQTACYDGPDGANCYSGDRCFRHTRT